VEQHVADAVVPHIYSTSAMAPMLVEMAPIKNTYSVESMMATPSVSNDALTPRVIETPLTAEVTPATVEEMAPLEGASELQLVIKNEQAEAPLTTRIGEHQLTREEIQERLRFEEQKKSLEERAERLRRMSFNIKGNESSEELENVPAYMRQKMQLDSSVASSDTVYSGYTVGMSDNQNNNQASLHTKNTFLDGKKPD
jgi:cell division protein FtsZ